MPLLALSHVSFRYAAETILDDITLAIEPGRKIGVIGQNGVGKSTLLRILDGRLEPTDGRVVRERGVRVAFQVQEPQYAPGATVRDEMRRVMEPHILRQDRLAEIEALLADASGREQERLLGEYETLQAEQTAAGTWDVQRRIETVLSSLGLPEEAWDQPVEMFSGGERNAVGLAGVLLAAPDVMLLDEPSNHLDAWGIEWFCEFVRATATAIVMVSHDRHVLDRTVDEIWDVRGGRLKSWTGNYTSYREQKRKADELAATRHKVATRAAEALEFQARRQMDMANAYDDPSQAKKAKNMRRRAERLRDDAPPPDLSEQRFRAQLKASGRAGDIALAIDGLSVAFGDRVIFDGAELFLTHGDRACLVGPNGSGKTTLFREILEHGSWENRTVRLGKSVKAGEYRQIADELLDPAETLLDWCQRETGLDRTPASKLLHRFLFSYDDLTRKVGTLSGGEKSRLQLARLMHEDVNLLLLDEPTNHLDIQACEQLEAMLRTLDGTLLVISHDQRFLDGLVDGVVELSDRRLHTFRGGFGDWWEDKRRRGEHVRKAALELRSRRGAASPDKHTARRERDERRGRQARIRKLKKDIARTEERVEQLESRKDELAKLLQDAYAPGADLDRARGLADELRAVQTELGSLTESWDALTADLGDDG